MLTFFAKIKGAPKHHGSLFEGFRGLNQILLKKDETRKSKEFGPGQIFVMQSSLWFLEQYEQKEETCYVLDLKKEVKKEFFGTFILVYARRHG